MESKAKYVSGSISVEIDLMEIVKTIDEKCAWFGFDSQENTKLRAIGLALICEGIKIGAIAEHKRMQDAYGEAIPLINRCVDFVELIQKIELGVSIPKGKA